MNKKIKKLFSDHVELHVLGIALVTTLVLFICLFLYVKTMNEMKKSDFIGRDNPVVDVLAVTGKGEVKITPNIASFYVSVIEEGKTTDDAQTKAATKTNKVLAYLRSIGIADKDIQSTNANVYPKYEYETAECSSNYCPPGKQTIAGYESNQSVTVKVRDVKKAGEILSGLSGVGASSISGPNFTVDNTDSYKSDARAIAIANAREQASQIAGQLGVKLGKVVNFYETNNATPYYLDSMMNKERSMGAAMPVVAELPTGESTITSEVTVTYEIK